MKLLILLFIISNVYCGITNNFTVLPNNDIYIAHTENSVIYKIVNSTNVEVVVGQEGFHNNTLDTPSITNGINLLLYKPTSIIHSLNNDIFFVNNNKYIKHFKTDNLRHSTRTINFNSTSTFNSITNITIDALYNLYIANYSNNSGISRIYKFEKQTVADYKYKLNKVIINEKIKAINYVDNNINVITNKNYYEYSLNLEENNTEKVTNKIESTNNTNKLEDIQDFVIDENFEIGYLAFQDRLKWFYF